jgi:hypothetical protein
MIVSKECPKTLLLRIATFMVTISGIACGKAGRLWPSYWEGHAIGGKRETGKFPKHFRFIGCGAALTGIVLALSRPLFLCSCSCVSS